MKSHITSHCLYRYLGAFLVIGVLVMSGGCSGGDFRAQDLPSKSEIQKKIDVVNASTTIPAAVKPRILDGLNRQLQQAK